MNELITWRNFTLQQRAQHKTPKTWKQYIESLHDWEYDILCDTRNQYIRILQALTTEGNKIQVVCNYTYNELTDGYAWAAIHDDRIIFSGCGKAKGLPLTKRRTEIFAHFAWAFTILHIGIFSGAKFKCTIQPFTTSKTIAKELRLNHDINTHKNSLSSDYDLLRSIKSYISTITTKGIRVFDTQIAPKKKKNEPAHPILQHIKTLTSMLDNQLQTHQPTNDNEEFLLPMCTVYLTNGLSPLTSNETYTSRWKWSEFQIQDYYCSKFNITLKELHTIDWAQLKQVREKLPTNIQTFSTKYTIDWLPTGSRMETQGEIVTGCIHCGCYETTIHLLQCHRRKEKVYDFIKRYKSFLAKKRTDPEMAITMIYYAASCLQELRDIPIPTTTTYNDAVAEQAILGWHNFIKGLWSKKWEHHQYTYEQKQKIKKNNWAHDNITWWINEGHKSWTERNEKLHEPATILLSRQHEEALEQVKFLYSLENEITHEDRNIFEMDLQTRLKFSTKSLQVWAKHMKGKIQNSIATQIQRIKTGQTTLSSWMTSAHSISTTAPANDKNNPNPIITETQHLRQDTNLPTTNETTHNDTANKNGKDHSHNDNTCERTKKIITQTQTRPGPNPRED